MLGINPYILILVLILIGLVGLSIASNSKHLTAQIVADFIVATLIMSCGILFIVFDIKLFLTSGQSMLPSKYGGQVIQVDSSWVFHVIAAGCAAIPCGFIIFYSVLLYTGIYDKIRKKFFFVPESTPAPATDEPVPDGFQQLAALALSRTKQEEDSHTRASFLESARKFQSIHDEMDRVMTDAKETIEEVKRHEKIMRGEGKAREVWIAVGIMCIAITIVILIHQVS